MVAQSGISARLTGILPSTGARSSVVEHLTFNQGVDGSIPSGLTIDFNGLVTAWLDSHQEFCNRFCKPVFIARSSFKMADAASVF